MEKYTVKLAGHTVQIESRFEKNRGFFSDYIVPDTTPELVARVSDDDIDSAVANVPDISRETAELTELYRPIAEGMPLLGGFVFHGAAISYDGKGYIFTAPSGTGKSTHIRLWRKYLGRDVDIINGDKPIITADERGVIVHGTPWSGKERWQKNVSFPLGGICLLGRGESCSVSKVDPAEHLPFLMCQTYRSDDGEVMARTMELLDTVLGCVPVYLLHCDISEDAVRCAFGEMCGRNYDDYRIKE